MVTKVGPLGKVFAVSGDDPVGVYGEVYGGRYLIFGAFIGIGAKTEPMQGTERKNLYIQESQMFQMTRNCYFFPFIKILVLYILVLVFPKRLEMGNKKEK